MLIVCPACASEYVIDATRLGAEGRSVRCASCRETWLITPDDVAAGLVSEMTATLAEARGPDPGAPAEDATASPGGQSREAAQATLDAWAAALADGDMQADPEPREPEVRSASSRKSSSRRPKPPPKKKGLAGVSAPAGFALAALAALALALVARSTVVRAMPQTAALYAGIGLPVNLRGLELRDVVAFQMQGEGGQGQLVVEGDVVGVASGLVPAPPIALVVRDGLGQILYRWTIPAPRPSLDNRETAQFRASLSAPPALGRSVDVAFADKESPAKELMPKESMAGHPRDNTDAGHAQP